MISNLSIVLTSEWSTGTRIV